MSAVVVDRASAQRSGTRSLRGVVVSGLGATVASVAATTLAAALARAVGVDFEVPAGGETIPLSGIAFVTGVLCLVGVVLAVALRRWSSRPAQWLLRTTVMLTAISLVPPVLSGAETSTVASLVGLHLVAAVVMVPALVRSVRPTR